MNNKAQIAKYAQNKKATDVLKPAAAKQTLTYQIISVDANTFGYDILSDGKERVHYP